MKRRDIHMHAVYVQGLNRIWADFMRRGQRRSAWRAARPRMAMWSGP